MRCTIVLILNKQQKGQMVIFFVLYMFLGAFSPFLFARRCVHEDLNNHDEVQNQTCVQEGQGSIFRKQIPF